MPWRYSKSTKYAEWKTSMTWLYHVAASNNGYANLNNKEYPEADIVLNELKPANCRRSERDQG